MNRFFFILTRILIVFSNLKFAWVKRRLFWPCTTSRTHVTTHTHVFASSFIRIISFARSNELWWENDGQLKFSGEIPFWQLFERKIVPRSFFLGGSLYSPWQVPPCPRTPPPFPMFCHWKLKTLAHLAPIRTQKNSRSTHRYSAHVIYLRRLRLKSRRKKKRWKKLNVFWSLEISSEKTVSKIYIYVFVALTRSLPLSASHPRTVNYPTLIPTFPATLFNLLYFPHFF